MTGLADRARVSVPLVADSVTVCDVLSTSAMLIWLLLPALNTSGVSSLTNCGPGTVVDRRVVGAGDGDGQRGDQVAPCRRRPCS